MTAEVARAYTAWSAQYDSNRNPTRDLDAQATRELLAGTRVDVIVEAGCGTGKNTKHYATLARQRVDALDFSAGMLEVARRQVTAPHVHFQQADLTAAWPVADAGADLVTFNLVLEHIESLPPLFAQATRVLRPGGRVLVSELHPFKQYLGSQARFVDEHGHETRVPACTHHVSEYLQAAAASGLVLLQLDEWWHPDDGASAVPRLLTLLLQRP